MPLQTVILRHDLPDGSSHFDWLLAVDDPPTMPLLTWRCTARPDVITRGGALALRRIEPHRIEYLDYEGPVSGNRGAVRRVASGNWHSAGGRLDAPMGETLKIEVVWIGSSVPQMWEITSDIARRTG